VKDEDVRHIIAAHTTLSSLDVSGCQITGKVFEHLNSFLPKLKKLRISREVNLGYTSRTYSVQIDDPPALTLSTLQHLDISGIHSVGKNFLHRLAEVAGGSLNHLDVHNVKGVTDVTFLPIARRCKTLSYLDLSYTGVGNSSLRAIGSTISTLKSLFLVCCSSLEGDCGIESVMKVHTRPSCHSQFIRF